MQPLNNIRELNSYVSSIDESKLIRTGGGIFTNLFDHNPITVAWLLASEYRTITGPNMFSVTELVLPPIIATLRRRHRSEAVMDVTDLTAIAIGRSIHHDLAIRMPESAPVFQEEELSAQLGSIKLRGQPDIWFPHWYYQSGFSARPVGASDDEGVIIDAKATNIYKVANKDFDDYDRQINGYAWLIQESLGLKTVHGEVLAVIDGWRKREAEVKPSYPQSKSHRIPIAIRPMDETQAWLEARADNLRLSLNTRDEDLIPCSEKERWQRPLTWRVVKKGNKRATKNFKESDGHTRLDAETFAADTKGNFDVIEVAGERTRCDRYCAFRPWCPLYS